MKEFHVLTHCQSIETGAIRLKTTVIGIIVHITVIIAATVVGGIFICVVAVTTPQWRSG